MCRFYTDEINSLFGNPIFVCRFYTDEINSLFGNPIFVCRFYTDEINVSRSSVCRFLCVIACSLHVLDVCTRGNKDFIFSSFYHMTIDNAQSTAMLKIRRSAALSLLKTPHSMSISWHGPLTKYVKLRVAFAPEMPGTFSPPLRASYSDMHHGTCDARAVMHVGIAN